MFKCISLFLDSYFINQTIIKMIDWIATRANNEVSTEMIKSLLGDCIWTRDVVKGTLKFSIVYETFLYKFS